MTRQTRRSHYHSCYYTYQTQQKYPLCKSSTQQTNPNEDHTIHIPNITTKKITNAPTHEIISPDRKKNTPENTNNTHKFISVPQQDSAHS